MTLTISRMIKHIYIIFFRF